MIDNECGMYAGLECLDPKGFCLGEACLRRLRNDGKGPADIAPDDLNGLFEGDASEPGTERSLKGDM